MTPPSVYVRFSLMVVAIGKPNAWPSAIAAAMSLNDSVTASRKIAPTMPDSQIDDRTPRGAWRLASTVSSPNVPAVSKPYTTKSAMNMPTRNTAK